MTVWRAVVLVVLVSASCGTKPPATSGEGGGAAASLCEAQRTKVEQLYRRAALEREPAGSASAARIDEQVADNTAMVMNDCVLDPQARASCIAAATSVSEIQARCLIPLDDEGTEGDRIAR